MHTTTPAVLTTASNKPVVKGILIDPFNRTISIIPIRDTLQDMYAAIGCEIVEAPYFSIAGIGQDCYVDEEGLMKPCDHFFKMKGCGCPLAGRGIIVSSDDEGNMQDAKVSIEQVMAECQFMDRRQAAAY